MITRQQLIAKRNEVQAALEAAGWDYDDARFATMTATANPLGFLSDQPTTVTPELLELAEMAKAAAAPAPAKVVNGRMNSDDEMEDQ